VLPFWFKNLYMSYWVHSLSDINLEK